MAMGSLVIEGHGKTLLTGPTIVEFERLWAPWRLSYVTGEDRVCEDLAGMPERAPDRLLPGGQPSCFLCRAAAHPKNLDSDRANHVVWRREQTVAVLNRYPYNNGHLLVAPRQHLGTFQEIPPEIHAEITETLGRFLSLMERLLHVDGFNVGLNLGRVAGAGLPGHLHWHIVPRWDGDHNFMPTLAGTRVIPQSLDAAWEVFRAALADSAFHDNPS
ncbi:MAG: HIT domain-containing protein [Pirellulales bacterium]|nr:HIT domain-containing protein [Pirellulales bacterium]